MNQNKHTCIHKYQIHIFEKIVLLKLLLLKEHIRLGHAGITDHAI